MRELFWLECFALKMKERNSFVQHSIPRLCVPSGIGYHDIEYLGKHGVAQGNGSKESASAFASHASTSWVRFSLFDEHAVVTYGIVLPLNETSI